MKIALTILCCLLFILGQAAALCLPVARAAQVNCGCGGKMSCCRQASVPQPVPAAARISSQKQILAPVPAVAARALTDAGTASISPTVSHSFAGGAVPIFARNCARLI